MKIRHTAYLVAALTVISVSACTSGNQDSRSLGESPRPEPTTITPSASRTDHAKDAALTAYTDMWRDVADASATADWQSARLDDHATGDALAVVTNALRRDRDRGLISKGQPTHSAQVSSQDPLVDPRTIRIEDCGDSSNWLKYQADTGELVDDTSGGRRAITAEVIRLEDGSWKVSRFAVRGVGTC